MLDCEKFSTNTKISSSARFHVHPGLTLEGCSIPKNYHRNQGGDSESAGAELSVEYHNFSVAQEGAEIFKFKVSPVLNSRHHIQKS